MSKGSRGFRHSISISKRYKKNLNNTGFFRYGKIMSLKYAKGYCNNHKCLLCAHDIKCKSCWKCKHFSEDYAMAIV